MNILVTDALYLGDVLFATPFFRGLRRAYPKATITLLMSRSSEELMRHNPYIDRRIIIDRPVVERRLFPFLHTLRALRAEQYDLVINLHGAEFISALAAFSKTKERCGMSAPLFRHRFNPFIREDKSVHAVDMYLQVLRALGQNSTDDGGLDLFIDDATIVKMDERWHELELDEQPVVALNPGGSWPTKRWPTSSFAELAGLLQERGITSLCLGGSMDRPLVEAMLAQTTATPVVLTGQLSLLELAAVLRRCAVLVSGDSGPLHIAASQQVPSVAIFGPSDPVRYRPYRAPHRLVRADMACLSCGRHACSHHRCMQEISARQVLAAVDALREGMPACVGA